MLSHLAYQPIVPCGNKYLQQKWDKISYNFHRNKVKSMQPTLDTKAPKKYDHLSPQRPKSKDMWTRTIERENILLLERLSHIMLTSGRVDNRNSYERKSLNVEKRQRELRQINMENQSLSTRLSQSKPHYDVKKLHGDWLQARKLVDAIARYPSRSQQGEEKPGKKLTRKKTTSSDTTVAVHITVNNTSKSTGNVGQIASATTRSTVQDDSEEESSNEKTEESSSP
ncbi:sperm axonemal maintenance protein CFAP97D1 [Stigmatopora argus]